MNFVDNMTNKQLIVRARNVFDDNDDVAGLCDLEDFYGMEIYTHITGMHGTMLKLADRLEEALGQIETLSDALNGARQALGEVE